MLLEREEMQGRYDNEKREFNNKYEKDTKAL